MSVPVQEVVELVLSLSGFIQAGEAPAPEDQALAVRVLNGLLGEWSSKRYINPNIWSGIVIPQFPNRVILSTLPSVLDPVTNTMVTPDFSEDLIYIDQLTCELGQVVYKPKKVSIAEYWGISVKTVSAIPQVWAWDQQSPTSIIWLWPQSLGGLGVRLVGLPRIPTTVSQGQIALDPVALDALVYNAYVRIYPHNPQPGGIDLTAKEIAASSLKGLTQRVAEQLNGPVTSMLGSSESGTSYWLSPLNTVNSST